MLVDSLGLHRVENPSHVDRSVSLHLYSPPFESCQMFDQRTGKKTACKVTFWSKFGERVSTVWITVHSLWNLKWIMFEIIGYRRLLASRARNFRIPVTASARLEMPLPVGIQARLARRWVLRLYLFTRNDDHESEVFSFPFLSSSLLQIGCST